MGWVCRMMMMMMIFDDNAKYDAGPSGVGFAIYWQPLHFDISSKIIFPVFGGNTKRFNIFNSILSEAGSTDIMIVLQSKTNYLIG